MEGEKSEGRGWCLGCASAPLALSPRYSGKWEGRGKLHNPMGGPLELHLLPVWLPQPHEEPTWENHGICIYSASLSLVPHTHTPPPPPLSTCTPRGLFYRKLSARPLLLCLRLRMGPLLSPIHTSPAAAKTESISSPIIDTAQSNSILSLSVCSLPLCTVCVLEQRNIVWRNLTRRKNKDAPRSQTSRMQLHMNIWCSQV